MPNIRQWRYTVRAIVEKPRARSLKGTLQAISESVDNKTKGNNLAQLNKNRNEPYSIKTNHI